ncbi:MAG: toxin-antitoxin system HicB family antitoxin [Eubacteriales bacterium]|nr:toxin-antitoxin system HicB family antitoxin [Eubacteriales bacterium]
MKGSFNIRISPELHRRLIIYITSHGMSLNHYIEETLENSPVAFIQ